jgi:hypothetical protein
MKLTATVKVNDRTIHLYHESVAEKYHVNIRVPNTQWYLAPRVTKDDIFKAHGLKSFDTAVPQSWWNEYFKENGKQPNAVWSYDGLFNVMGKPVHMHEALQTISNEINRNGIVEGKY